MVQQLFVPLLTAYLGHAPRQLRKFRVAKFLARFCHGARIETGLGPRIRIDSRDDTNLFAIYGTYTTVEGYLRQCLKPGDCFLDIGANLGLFSIFAARQVGRSGHVFAFEPSPRELVSLTRNLLENQCENVTVLGVCVTDEAGIRRFNPGPDSHTGVGSLSTSEQGGISAFCTDLSRGFPNLLESLADRSLVIKIDVEGAELHVIQSLDAYLDSPGIKSVIVEVHKQNLERFGAAPQDLYRLMDAKGYRPVGTERGDWYDEMFIRDNRPA